MKIRGKGANAEIAEKETSDTTFVYMSNVSSLSILGPRGNMIMQIQEKPGNQVLVQVLQPPKKEESFDNGFDFLING